MNIYFTLPSEVIEKTGKDLAGIKDDISSMRLPNDSKIILQKVKDKLIERFKIFEDEINKRSLIQLANSVTDQPQIKI